MPEAEFAANLVARLRDGDDSAWADMCRHYGPGLTWMLRRRTGGDVALAEDLRQETLMEARSRIAAGELREPEKLAAFLHSTAKFKAIGVQRKARRQATSNDPEAIAAAVADSPGPFDDVSREQTARLVRQLLAELPVERDREILVRTYLRDDDKADICADLGLDGKVFDNALHRARKRFRELLLHAERRNRIGVVGK